MNIVNLKTQMHLSTWVKETRHTVMKPGKSLVTFSGQDGVAVNFLLPNWVKTSHIQKLFPIFTVILWRSWDQKWLLFWSLPQPFIEPLANDDTPSAIQTWTVKFARYDWFKSAVIGGKTMGLCIRSRMPRGNHSPHHRLQRHIISFFVQHRSVKGWSNVRGRDIIIATRCIVPNRN